MSVRSHDREFVPIALPGPRFSARWILNARADLLFIIGSVLAGYLVFGMHAVLGWNMLLVWFIWVIVLDTPHFFATYSRTYLDSEERKYRKALLIGSLGVFLIGPVAIVASYGLKSAGAAHFVIPWLLFKITVSLWAYWHITRQHYGVMRLYHRKNDEHGGFDAKLDALVLYGCLLVPFGALLARHHNSRMRVGLSRHIPQVPEWTGVSGAGQFVRAMSWEHWVIGLTIACVVVLITAFILRQIYKVLMGEQLNLPKILFFFAVLPLHIYMCYTEHLLTTGLLTFTAIVTIYHDIQYLAIVWFYNRNRYGPPTERKKRFGLAEKVTRKVWIWMGVAIVFGSIPVWGLGCLINRIPICQTGPHLGDPTFLGQTTWIVFFVLLTAGLQMHHYILDQYIWRPGRSKQLREDLKLEDRNAAA